MAVYDQIATTYSDTTPDVRVISDVISMIDPADAPLVARLGIASANEKFRINMNGYKVELLEDSYAPLSDALDGSIATNTTALTVDDASVFQPGDVLLIDSEYVWVSAINTSTEVVTVTRNFGGTQATHADNAVVYIKTRARLEGDDADYGPLVDITAPFNYTQIFQKGLNISRTQKEIDKYGMSDYFSYQANKGVPELMRLLDSMAFHGQRAAGSATTPRGAGGLLTFITDNTVNAGGAIAKADLDGLSELIALDGGNPDLLVVNPSIANDIRGLLDSSSFVRVGQKENSIGMRVDTVMTQFAELEILADRWCPTTHAYMLDSRKVGFYTLTPFNWYEIGKTGDGQKAELIGEFSLLAANDKAHGFISGITT